MTVRDKLSNRRENSSESPNGWQANLRLLEHKGLEPTHPKAVSGTGGWKWKMARLSQVWR